MSPFTHYSPLPRTGKSRFDQHKSAPTRRWRGPRYSSLVGTAKRLARLMWNRSLNA
jgi:hypothetical protein